MEPCGPLNLNTIITMRALTEQLHDKLTSMIEHVPSYNVGYPDIYLAHSDARRLLDSLIYLESELQEYAETYGEDTDVDDTDEME